MTFVGLDVTLDASSRSHTAQLLVCDRPLARAIGVILDLDLDLHQPQYGGRCTALHDPLAAATGVGTITEVNSPWVDIRIDDSDGPGRGQTIAELRGQRLGSVDQPGANEGMFIDTDRRPQDHLVERLTARAERVGRP